jgi:hypothetical protein
LLYQLLKITSIRLFCLKWCKLRISVAACWWSKTSVRKACFEKEQ